jgi:hypothetical protein
VAPRRRTSATGLKMNEARKSVSGTISVSGQKIRRPLR